MNGTGSTPFCQASHNTDAQPICLLRIRTNKGNLPLYCSVQGELPLTAIKLLAWALPETGGSSIRLIVKLGMAQCRQVVKCQDHAWRVGCKHHRAPSSFQKLCTKPIFSTGFIKIIHRPFLAIPNNRSTTTNNDCDNNSNNDRNDDCENDDHDSDCNNGHNNNRDNDRENDYRDNDDHDNHNRDSDKDSDNDE